MLGVADRGTSLAPASSTAEAKRIKGEIYLPTPEIAHMLQAGTERQAPFPDHAR